MTKTQKAPKTQSGYNVSVRISGKEYKAKGDTVTGAITKLDVGTAHGIAILSVTKGGKTKEKVLSKIQTTRLFNTRNIARDVVLKNISLMFE